MAKKTPPVEYIPDGPIMSLLRKPQLMYCLLYTSDAADD